ncbi:imidazolonepropionase, partial [bacterium]|nr:imidazolonepropionase [bacterium]
MIDLLIAPCGQLLTLAGGNDAPRRAAGLGDVGLVADGVVGINVESGAIEYAGPQADLDRSLLSKSSTTIEAEGCVVMPGFVDSHTHLVFAGSRADEFYRRGRGESYHEIAQSGGIAATLAPTRQATVEELVELAGQRLYRLYNNGTTTVEIKSGYGLSRDAEMKSLEAIRRLREKSPGLIFSTFLGAHLIPPEYEDRRGDYVELVIEMLNEVAADGLADFYDIFVDPLAFSKEEAARVVEAGSRTALGLRLHGDEFGDDGTAAWGVSVGAMSVDHLGGIGAGGIKALAGSATIATLLPATMFFCGHGKYAPAREMIDAGCAIALATDLNPGSSLVYSMPFTMTLAAMQMGMSAGECIVASTINGAHALGISEKVGSLEAGKRADIIIAGVPDYRELAYHVGCDLIRDVIIGGRVVKRMYVLPFSSYSNCGSIDA